MNNREWRRICNEVEEETRARKLKVIAQTMADYQKIGPLSQLPGWAEFIARPKTTTVDTMQDYFDFLRGDENI